MFKFKMRKLSIALLGTSLMIPTLLAPVFMPTDAAHAATTTKSAKIFGTKEIRSSNLKKFTKWNGAMKRYATEIQSELNKCKLSATNKCLTTKWRIFLKKIEDRPKAEQVQLVNQYLNKWRYVIDPVNYQKNDYWATPKQFLNRNGDCEDYAIIKYKSLIHLGFDKDDMRIVVIEDLNLRVPHAVLVVYIDGQPLVLDNQISKVVHADRIKHYKPVYSINESNWWLHRGFRS